MKVHPRISDKMSNCQESVSCDENSLDLASDPSPSTLQVIDRHHLITNHELASTVFLRHKIAILYDSYSKTSGLEWSNPGRAVVTSAES